MGRLERGFELSESLTSLGHRGVHAALQAMVQPVQALLVVGQGARHGSLQLMVEAVQAFLSGVHALARCVLELVC